LNKKQQLVKGIIDIFPLTFSCIPWGILVGSLAVSIGLSPFESQSMSLFIFAGAGQLVSIGLLKAGAGLSTIFLTAFFITARHFLYSIAMRDAIQHFPLYKRLLLGFILTDEMFALNNTQVKKEFNFWYAIGSGFSFYIGWNLSTLMGVLAGSVIPNLEDLGLDFTVVAVFIALVVPLIKNIATIATIGISLLCSVWFSLWQIPASLLLSAIIAMSIGYFCETVFTSKVKSQKIKSGDKK